MIDAAHQAGLNLSQLMIMTKYARYDYARRKRLSFDEIMDNLSGMHHDQIDKICRPIDRDRAHKTLDEAIAAIKRFEIMPSMRSLQFAGAPIVRNHARIYNCAYAPLDAPEAFSEGIFLLLGGTGYGYSVRRHHIDRMGEFQGWSDAPKQVYVIGDSIEGWAEAVLHLISSCRSGMPEPEYDYSQIRDKGAPLITTGGKAPGPEPLRRALNAAAEILRRIKGRRIRSVEAHDVMCLLARAVQSGGIRRSAMISIFDPNDDDMISAKSTWSCDGYDVVSSRTSDTGAIYYDIMVTHHDPFYGHRTQLCENVSQFGLSKLEAGEVPWWIPHPHRGASNNSAALRRDMTTREQFFRYWDKSEETKSGDPGLLWVNDDDGGANPCVEIGMVPNQMCNLTEANLQTVKSQKDFERRAYLASFIGTLQASYTSFHLLRDVWRKNCEREALLGVSLTGIAGCGMFSQLNLTRGAQAVLESNAIWSQAFGISATARATCVKPSGTASLVMGTSSGIHAYYGDYYIRRTKLEKGEPLYEHLLGICPGLIEDDVTDPMNMYQFTSPMRAPEGAIKRDEKIFDFLARILRVSKEWVAPGHVSGANSHNVSTTLELEDNEWGEVGEWMWENRYNYNGMAYMPRFHGFEGAPFQEIDRARYEKMLESVKPLALDELVEEDDYTHLGEVVACAGGACEYTF